jgi:hypothetical protein
MDERRRGGTDGKIPSFWPSICEIGLLQQPFFGEAIMPRGDKSAYTDKQKRQAEHIEQSYEERGISEKEAERRAWATVNKQSGGGKKSGSGRKKKESNS